MKLQEMKPVRKVGAGLLGGSLTVVLLFVVQSIWPDFTIPAAVASAATVLVTFAVSWFVPAEGT